MAKKQIATFLGTQKGISIIGDHCYAFSGISASSATPQIILDFTIGGKEYIMASFQPVYIGDSTNNIEWKILLNGEVVSGVELSSSRDFGSDHRLFFVIPPLTHVQVQMDNLSGGTEDAGGALTGRVYR